MNSKNFQISVELEPPELYHPEIPSKTLETNFLNKIEAMGEFCDWISITNRHIYNMSSLTACNKALKVLRKHDKNNIKLAMHLTTRLNAIDTYKQLMDIQEVGLRYLMPLLGDPRGPKAPGYFENALDILRYVSFMSTGDIAFLDQLGARLDKLITLPRKRLDGLQQAFGNNIFKLGTVLDPNPFRLIDGKLIPIRDKELNLYPKKITAGANYFMSQAIFSAEYFFEFIDELNPTNQKPIGIGLIPTRVGLSERIGVPISKNKIDRLKAQPDQKSQISEGNKITNEILRDLLYRGSKNVDWIHIYSFGSIQNVFDILGDEIPDNIQNSSK